ncbi:MAG: saccharopine dehydrogenase C-terminal domain-containing protein [Bacteroidota bacterium]|nr:saccharopine dehydrogenase C-terminal domain-containing protein [Bacteroidota bacterium]
MKKVLVLGAGMVAGPMVDQLLNSGYKVTSTGIYLHRAQGLIKGHENGSARVWVVEDEEGLREMISQHDLVVSLLPPAFHAMVARHCISLKTNMVTTSYVGEEMKSLDEEARKAGVIILNEIGLDPGIDHMSALRVIDHVHKKGGKINKFFSLCGALPSPESADNPYRYKFSWSPKGVIMASDNEACYLKNGTEVKVKSIDLFKEIFQLDFPGVGVLDIYPNRDSVKYIDLYGIPEVSTMFRGTFRLPGWCEALDLMKGLKLLSNDKILMEGLSYAGMLARLIGEADSENIMQKAADFQNIDVGSNAMKALDWLGVFADSDIGRKEDSPFEVISDLMIEKMSLQLSDQDMVVLQHNFHASYPDGSREIIKARMLDYGSQETFTSIARTVSLPAALASILILEGKIQLSGVYRPIVPEIYNPILNKLEEIGIKVEETYGLKEDGDLF